MTAAELATAVFAEPPFHDLRLANIGDPSAPDHRWFAKLVRFLKPKYIVELGTGDGATAAQIAAALHEFSYFVTINWPNPPSGDNPGRYLEPWRGSWRVKQILGDTREVFWQIPNGVVDLLYIDSTHTHDCVRAEWALYRPKLADVAVVVVDDLDHGDMREFWNPLPYDKCEMRDGCMGMFIYKAGVEC